MSELLNQSHVAVRARAAHRRTVSEIHRMDPHVARDLGLDPTDAARIAHSAVYGL